MTSSSFRKNPSFALSAVVAALLGGCASSMSAAQVQSDAALTRQLVQDAEAATAKRAGRSVELAASARSSLDYAMRSTGQPEHAARLCEMARADADLAIVLARLEAKKQRAEHPSSVVPAVVVSTKTVSTETVSTETVSAESP